MRLRNSLLFTSFLGLVAWSWSSLDARADLLVSDTGGGKILAYDASMATSAPATFATIASPLGLAYGLDNNLYVATGSSIAQLNGTNGAVINASFASVAGLFGASAVIHDVILNPNDGFFYATVDVPDGSKFDGKVVKISSTGTVTSVYDPGANKVSLEGLTLGTIGAQAGHLFVVSADNAGNNSNQLYEMTTSGTLLNTITLPGVAYDVTTRPSDGNLFVAIRTGNSNNTVQQYTEAGTSLGQFSSGYSQPQGVIFDAGLNLFVSQSNTPSILKTPPTGGTATTFSLPPQPSDPTYMTFQPAGVPEPGLIALLSMAGVAMTAYGWRCRKQRVAA